MECRKRSLILPGHTFVFRDLLFQARRASFYFSRSRFADVQCDETGSKKEKQVPENKTSGRPSPTVSTEAALSVGEEKNLQGQLPLHPNVIQQTVSSRPSSFPGNQRKIP